MLGTYRLALALLVALSHIDVKVAGLNPGVVAVVGFYMVSGYVMTGLIRTWYGDVAKVPAFYVDRAVRLFPQYLFIVFLTLAWYLWIHPQTEFLKIRPGLLNYLENLSVVPLNYYMFNHSDDFTLVPPAWSLGAEIQFYLVFPILLLTGAVPVRFSIVSSALIYLLASFGYIDSDWFAYRLLPGVLFMFLLGSVLYDVHQRPDRGRRGWMLVAAVVIGSGAMAEGLTLSHKLALPYNEETLTGLVLGVVAVNTLGNRRRQIIDDAIGNLSYGVFLSHFLVLWVVFDSRVVGIPAAAGYLAASLAVAAVTYRLVERPALALRKRFRRSHAATVAAYPNAS